MSLQVKHLSWRHTSLWLILGLEILTAPVVIAIFKNIEEREKAGLIAGVYFVLSGSWIFIRNLKWYEFKKSPVFWLSAVHLFFISVPLLTTRVLTLGTSFEEISVLGIPGPQFHKVSERILLALTVATIYEIWRIRSLIRESLVRSREHQKQQ